MDQKQATSTAPADLAAAYAEFCQATPSPASGLATTTAVLPAIKRDLVVSAWRLAALYLAASLCGYAASLSICAQNSFGMSGFAHELAAALHRLPQPWCAVVCGAVFGLVPTLVTTLLLNRFRHRYLLFRMWWLPLTVPVLAAWSMAAMPSVVAVPVSGMWSEPGWLASWVLAAVATPYVVEGVAALLLRQRPARP